MGTGHPCKIEVPDAVSINLAAADMSENELFTHLTGYYAQFAPGAKTEPQLRDMASRVKVVSFFCEFLPSSFYFFSYFF